MTTWDDETLRITARSNWTALLEVLQGCALDWQSQLERDDFDELFLLGGVDGVRWQFEDLGWLTETMTRQLAAFSAAVAALGELGDAAYEHTAVRDAPEWAELRVLAAKCLRVFPSEPWSDGV